MNIKVNIKQLGKKKNKIAELIFRCRAVPKPCAS